MEGANISASVDVIAGNGVSDMTEMDTDLVDTSRFQCQFEEGEPIIAFKKVIMSDRMTTTGPCYCHLPLIPRTSDNAGIDGSRFVRRYTTNNSVVVACGGVCFKLSREVPMGVIRLSSNNYAGGIFIETMHDTGTLNAAYAG